METILFYFNTIVSLIIILESVSSFFTMKLVHATAYKKYNKNLPQQQKNHMKLNTYVCILLTILTFLTLPIDTLCSYIHYGFSPITINKLIVSTVLITIVKIADKFSKHPNIMFSYRNYPIFYMFTNAVSTIALLALLYPTIKFFN